MRIGLDCRDSVESDEGCYAEVKASCAEARLDKTEPLVEQGEEGRIGTHS